MKPPYNLLAAAYADISMAVLQFSIALDRIEDPTKAATMARENRELFLSHKPVRLFRKRKRVKPH